MPKYDLIEAEIQWCETHRNPDDPEQTIYQDGFVAGLYQALWLMKSRQTNENYIPKDKDAVIHPDWYSLALLKRIELTNSQIDTLLKNELSTRSRKKVLQYFRARKKPRKGN